MSLTLRIRAKLWLYAGPGGWHFITLPPKRGNEVKSVRRGMRRGWGAVPVTATIGTSTWKTSLFPEKKSASYVLPVKAGVRNKEGLADGDMVNVILKVFV